MYYSTEVSIHYHKYHHFQSYNQIWQTKKDKFTQYVNIFEIQQLFSEDEKH